VGRYRYIAAYLGAPYSKIAELHLTGVEWQRLRNGAGTFKGSLKLPPPGTEQARTICALYKGATEAAATCIYVVRDNVPQSAYAVWTQGYSSESQTISISGNELSSYFTRRIIEDLSGDLEVRVSFEGQPMYDAVKDMVSRVNDIGLTLDVEAGGPILPVTVPATDDTSEVAGTGWKGTDAKKVAEAIDELASQDDGFDYRTGLVKMGGEYGRVFVLRANFAEHVGVIGKYGATCPSFSVNRRGDTRSNDAIAIGGSDGDKRPYGRVTTGSFVPPMTTVIQNNDEADTDRLDAAAQAAIDASATGEVVSFELIEDGVDVEIGGFLPGDMARLLVPQHRDPWYPDGLDTTVKTLGFTVRVPDSGGRETVALQIDEGDFEGG
jgi:hypothetical protein